MGIKERLYKKCIEFIDGRFDTVQNTISEIQKSLLSETKSSAGDKHETGRAMLQLEREKTGQQLAEIKKVKEIVTRINFKRTTNVICLGSVIYTSQGNYYIGISAGEIKIDNDLFYAISPNTPIGQLLMSKTVGDSIEFRGLKSRIINVL